MRNRFAVVVAVSAVSLGAATGITSCSFGNGSFACQGNNAACGGGGVCQPDGFCSLPDLTCTGTGQRYGDQSGPSSGKCVPLPTGNGGPDASVPDAVVVPPDAATFCYGTGIVHVCFTSEPTGTFAVAKPMTVSTDDPKVCAVTLSGAENYCVIAAADISINAGLRATGSKPLVLLAVHTITTSVASIIDVGSHRGKPEILGAGHDPVGCPDVKVGAPADGGGGAGGSFMSQGGAGGAGVGPGAGGTAGSALAAAPTTLRGGCPGQDGAGQAGSGAHGGGAVFLIAGTSIQVDGDIGAGGEGGAGGSSAQNAGTANGAGGGGAGAGGMIGFDAPTVIATRSIAAGGGGGGEGGSGTSNNGNNGADDAGAGPSAGGSGATTSGGDGGVGSINGSVAGGAGAAGTGTTGGTGGGGGGGGGAGFIIASKGANLGDQVSPPPTILP